MPIIGATKAQVNPPGSASMFRRVVSWVARAVSCARCAQPRSWAADAVGSNGTSLPDQIGEGANDRNDQRQDHLHPVHERIAVKLHGRKGNERSRRAGVRPTGMLRVRLWRLRDRPWTGLGVVLRKRPHFATCVTSEVINDGFFTGIFQEATRLVTFRAKLKRHKGKGDRDPRALQPPAASSATV